MNPRFKPNNFIALLIAIVLIVIGFVLGFINKQSMAAQEPVSAVPEEPAIAPVLQKPADDASDPLSEVAMIHAEIGGGPGTVGTSEVDRLLESLDMSDAPEPRPERVHTDGYDVYVGVTKEYLDYFFEKVGYTGEKIDAGETTAVPPVLLVSIKQGWADDITVQFKKSIFYRVMLSLVLFENEAILRDRETLLSILSAGEGGPLDAGQLKRLNELAQRYGVIEEASGEPLSEGQKEELLLRVDMVPPSLALAQAAHESGYASSRFAHTGNALFGQWDWGANTIKPKDQRGGMGNYGIRAFDQPIDSVHSYMRNLNTHRAYAGFRSERAAQRGGRRGRISMDALKLADTLTSYSERGTEYTEELKGTMRFNRLNRADGLRLLEGEPIYFH